MNEEDGLAALHEDYMSHCVECFLGMPNYCTGDYAPNGLPCATTPEQITKYIEMMEKR
jgi:hypothetical protein